jgi:hypothetical protein
MCRYRDGIVFQTGRRAVHVNLKIVDDDLVHPDVAASVDAVVESR